MNTDNNNDAINPSHYCTNKGIECIEAIEASLTEEQFIGFLKGNVYKYIWRAEKKGEPLINYQKAQWYLSRLIAVCTKSKK